MLPLRGLVTRRADIIGIQSVYFRIRVKDVLTRFVQVIPAVQMRNTPGNILGCIAGGHFSRAKHQPLRIGKQWLSHSP